MNQLPIQQAPHTGSIGPGLGPATGSSGAFRPAAPAQQLEVTSNIRQNAPVAPGTHPGPVASPKPDSTLASPRSESTVREQLGGFGRSLLRITSPLWVGPALLAGLGYAAVSGIKSLVGENTFLKDMAKLEEKVGDLTFSSESLGTDLKLTGKLFQAVGSAMKSCFVSESYEFNVAEQPEPHSRETASASTQTTPATSPRSEPAPAQSTPSVGTAQGTQATSEVKAKRDDRVDLQKLEKGEVVVVSAQNYISKRCDPQDLERISKGEEKEDLRTKKLNIHFAKVAASHMDAIGEEMVQDVVAIGVKPDVDMVEGSPVMQKANNYGLKAESVEPVGKPDTDGLQAIKKLTYIDESGDPQTIEVNPNSQVRYNPADGKVYPTSICAINADVCKCQESTKGAFTMVYCDGAGHGRRAQRAAEVASETAQKYVESKLTQIRMEGRACTTQTVARIHLEALKEAHKAVIALGNEAGTTTISITTLIDGYQVSTTLGDPMACDTNAEGVSRNLTPEDRTADRDPTDCGGRIGGYVTVGKQNDFPDLRNLRITVNKATDGNLFLFSDGIHDNYNPKGLGLAPREVAEYLIKQDGVKNEEDISTALKGSPFNKEIWEEVNTQEAEKLAAKYMTVRLAEDTGGKTPLDALNSIGKYVEETTMSSKLFMIQNNVKLPDDHKKYKGKIDHAVRVAVKVKKG